MKKLMISILMIIPLLCTEQIFAFCGFYVTKVDAQLFNKSSQVIIARHGEKTTITMSNDFKGDVKDFAMVVPVPVLLKRKDIRISEQSLFSQLDAYSGPRLVEYHDTPPCYNYEEKEDVMMLEEVQITSMSAPRAQKRQAKKYKVTIEAKYEVGEYDILMLSAKESDSLKRWLLDNGYKIPEKAEEVLEPYIKSKMKFFVVKVNLEKREGLATNNLRPLQISFKSWRFGLPIRLGMANAQDAQDLIVYAFTEKGRVETSNYRTVKMPSNFNVPEFVDGKFPEFYKSLFEETYYDKNKRSVFLEYAWSLDATNPVKCDPCPQMPPIYNYETLAKSGVDWIKPRQSWGGTNYTGQVFFTRLHVRYDRQNFPQDLTFMETPNREHFQGRYVIQRSVKHDLACEGALKYFKRVKKRRVKELEKLEKMTGWYIGDFAFYMDEIDGKIEQEENRLQKLQIQKGAVDFMGNWWSYLFAVSLLLIYIRVNRSKSYLRS